LLVSIRQPEQMILSEGSQPLLSRRELLGMSVLWFALNFQFAALLPIVVPAQILLLVTPGAAGSPQQALVLGGLAALGAITAVILQPLVGALSDRTASRLGRRRPYIIAGGVLMLIGLTLLAASRMIVPYIIGLFLVVVANTVSGTAYQGLVPDKVPAKQRGVASGYMGLMTILGTVGSLAVASTLLGQSTTSGHSSSVAGAFHGAALFYALAAGVLVASVLLTVAAVREVPHHLHLPHHHHHHYYSQSQDRAAGPPAPAEVRSSDKSLLYQRLAHIWLTPWRHANFTWVFLTRGFVMLGLALFMTYIEYYFARVQHLPNFIQATAFNAIMALLGAVCSTLVLGIISDRTRRVPIVFVSTACMALAALTFVVAPGRLPLWPLGILFGLGYGAYMSVDVALAVDALPSRSDAGKDLGLWNIASTLQSVIAPLLGSIVIFVAGRLGVIALGYRTIFGLATVFLLLGAIFILKVRETRRLEKDPGVEPAVQGATM
jgi:MFS family permease